MQYDYTPGQVIKENKILLVFNLNVALSHNCDNMFII